MKKRSFAAFLRRNAVAVLCAAGLFVLFYQIIYTFRLSPVGHWSDYNAHMLWAIGIQKSELRTAFFDGSNRLWHICVYLIYTYLLPNGWKAAGLVTAAADTAAYLVLFKLWDRAVSERFPRWLLALLTFFPFLAEALMLPGGIFYMRGDKLIHALNTWHNPTNIMVRPFALAVFYMTVDMYDRCRFGRGGILPPADKAGKPFVFEGGFFRQFLRPVYTWWELVLYPVCMLLSLYSKPSFIQFFAPAILIFLLIDVIRTRGMLLPFCIKLAAPFLLGGWLVLYQLAHSFGSGVLDPRQIIQTVMSSVAGGSHGIRVYFVQGGFAGVGEFLTYLVGAVKPLVLFCALPLFLLAVSPKKGLADTASRLGLICAIVGQLEALVLHETGSRATDGNFMWGWSLAAWVFWGAVIGRWTDLLLEGRSTRAGKLTCTGGTALLAWHLIAGIAYVVVILRTTNYQY